MSLYLNKPVIKKSKRKRIEGNVFNLKMYKNVEQFIIDKMKAFEKWKKTKVAPSIKFGSLSHCSK